MTHRGNVQGLPDLLSVGTSAGGARAKAVIAWNRATNEVRSGRIAAGEGFEYWLLKFDGVAGNKDKELDDPKGYGAIALRPSSRKCRRPSRAGRSLRPRRGSRPNGATPSKRRTVWHSRRNESAVAVR